MRDLKELQNYWHQHEDDEKILCTIIAKDGSAYRGPGSKKIVLKNGDSCGYLSGGCLEGDIIRTAIDEWDRAPFTRAFSTMSDEDRLMGYQTGCSGIITILFEKLPSDISEMEKYLPYGENSDIAGVAISLKEKDLGDRIILDRISSPSMDGYFIEEWVEPIKLYVVGCGANARPFAELAPPLGWEVTFLDYRQGNVIAENSSVTSKILPIEQISQAIPEGKNTYVVVMTHNYEADMAIVRQLNKKSFGYLGCVGPRKRFEQIQADLKKFNHVEIDRDWAKTVHAPAGLKQGRSPEDIAFSIIAQMQLGEAA
jgi:xanthine dehydrogenase accessory factor